MFLFCPSGAPGRDKPGFAASNGETEFTSETNQRANSCRTVPAPRARVHGARHPHARPRTGRHQRGIFAGQWRPAEAAAVCRAGAPREYSRGRTEDRAPVSGAARQRPPFRGVAYRLSGAGGHVGDSAGHVEPDRSRRARAAGFRAGVGQLLPRAGNSNGTGPGFSRRGREGRQRHRRHSDRRTCGAAAFMPTRAFWDGRSRSMAACGR